MTKVEQQILNQLLAGERIFRIGTKPEAQAALRLRCKLTNTSLVARPNDPRSVYISADPIIHWSENYTQVQDKLVQKVKDIFNL